MTSDQSFEKLAFKLSLIRFYQILSLYNYDPSYLTLNVVLYTQSSCPQCTDKV